jgi:hypothetical protein
LGRQNSPLRKLIADAGGRRPSPRGGLSFGCAGRSVRRSRGVWPRVCRCG